ncbi:hypothetical protein HOLleu_27369 [Holothuria leucospilota]|uniref:Uncharacterized protein n=1 Tax=Holothuria leucospilota TaxID=206669 RepID=A0A9Q1H0T0_HOLLE|nr:hypothetical protein HOLleu_27369 [Holothuria leucospilota]
MITWSKQWKSNIKLVFVGQGVLFNCLILILMKQFSPTARITSIRALMQFICKQYDLVVHQMELENTYLNARNRL